MKTIDLLKLTSNVVKSDTNKVSDNDHKLICDIYEKIMKSDKVEEAPVSVVDTILNDQQINDILSYLLMLQEKYFSDIPLSSELCKQFMWNIPLDIYELFRDAIDYDRPDYLNPITLFYYFCTKDANDHFSFFKFITRINELMNDDEEYIIKHGEQMEMKGGD